MGNNVYAYKEKDLLYEAMYQKKRLMNFISDLGYFGGVTYMEEANWKHLYRLIDDQLVIEARS